MAEANESVMPRRQGFLVGEKVGGNDRLAVTGTGGMKYSVDERDAHQRPQR